MKKTKVKPPNNFFSGCPFDGYHQPKPWVDEATKRSGLSCRFCHKTWEYIDGVLIATWTLRSWE